jgi:hypothetical protein
MTVECTKALQSGRDTSSDNTPGGIDSGEAACFIGSTGHSVGERGGSSLPGKFTVLIGAKAL